jgi:hypothetical protein
MKVSEQDLLERKASASPKPMDLTGHSYPVGATLVPGGGNFSVFSRSAESNRFVVVQSER